MCKLFKTVNQIEKDQYLYKFQKISSDLNKILKTNLADANFSFYKEKIKSAVVTAKLICIDIKEIGNLTKNYKQTIDLFYKTSAELIEIINTFDKKERNNEKNINKNWYSELSSDLDIGE